jgi:hypothetical protein
MIELPDDHRMAPLLALRDLLPLPNDAEARRERKMARRIDQSKAIRK